LLPHPPFSPLTCLAAIPRTGKLSSGKPRRRPVPSGGWFAAEAGPRSAWRFRSWLTVCSKLSFSMQQAASIRPVRLPSSDTSPPCRSRILLRLQKVKENFQPNDTAAMPAAVSENTRGRSSDRPRDPQMPREARSRWPVHGSLLEGAAKSCFGRVVKCRMKARRTGRIEAACCIEKESLLHTASQLRNRQAERGRSSEQNQPPDGTGRRRGLPDDERPVRRKVARHGSGPERRMRLRRSRGVPRRRIGPDATSITMQQHPRCRTHSRSSATHHRGHAVSKPGSGKSSHAVVVPVQTSRQSL
jgi:hypothetical protein